MPQNLFTPESHSDLKPMTATTESPKSNNNLRNIISAIIIIVVLLSLGSLYNKRKMDEQHDKDVAAQVKNDNDKMQRDNEMKKQVSDKMSQDAMMKNDATNVQQSLINLLGKYSGTSALLTQSLVFPKSTLVLDISGVQLSAEGLDLALLQKPQFQVNGVYPKVKLDAKASANPKPDGSVDLLITSLNPTFTTLVNGVETPVDATTTQSIVTGLGQAGITIPTISATNPVTIPVTITPTTTGVSIKSTAASPLFVSFTGNKTV